MNKELERQIKVLKKVETGLIDEDDFLHKAIESLPFPFYIIDVNDYMINYMNSAARMLYGDKEKTCYSLTHKSSKPCSLKEHPCPLKKVRETKKPVCVEHIHYDKDGNSKFFEVSGFPIFDNKGNIVKVIECIVDISDRKKAEDKLRESEEKFRNLFNNANDAIYLWELNEDRTPGKCLEVNDIATQMLGYSKEEFFKMTPRDIDAEESIRTIPKIMEILLENGNATFEAIHLTKDGRRVPVEVRSHLFYLRNKGLILSVTRDITKRKKMQSELDKHRFQLEKLVEERTSELSEANKQLQKEIKERKSAEKKLKKSREELRNLYTYLQTVSEEERKHLAFELHDHFGQYLSTILLMIQSIYRSKTFTEGQLKDVESKINRLIDDLQKLAFDLRPSILDDYGLDYALKRYFNETMKYSKVKIEYQYVSSNKSSRLSGEMEITLYRIIQEAVTNIIRHADSEQAHIILVRNDNEITLIIKDNGNGFDKNILRSKHKSCLGLISMRERVNLLNGDFSIESFPSKGTTIRIKIPIKEC